jgi:hypothetical protein
VEGKGALGRSTSVATVNLDELILVETGTNKRDERIAELVIGLAGFSRTHGQELNHCGLPTRRR